jgi:antitoxin YefM
MTKVLSIAELRSNLASEFDHVCENKRNQIIVKRPKGKGNVVIISQDAFNSIEETLYLLSSKKSAEHILESVRELDNGLGKKFKRQDLWK